jgi:ssDNA-binding Zn-finger/Zn-ribbon topoisomerase 1
MPNLNEFINKPEKIVRIELEKFKGVKPCSKCEKDSDIYYWDAINMIISWECPDGHKNSFMVQ